MLEMSPAEFDDLVSQALDEVRAEGLDVVATCKFVRSYIERHQEYADLLAG